MHFGPLALVVAAGLVGPLLASMHRLAPPVVIGEIIAGTVIGASGLRWIDPSDPLLAGLASVGFALLMFIVGTRLPVRDRHLRSALLAGAGLTITVGAAAAVAGVLLAPRVGLDDPALLAVLMATSSGAVALPILHEVGLAGRPALVATAWIAIADVATVLCLPVVLATGRVARVLLGGVLVVALGGCLYLIGRALRGREVLLRIQHLSRTRGWGLDLRVSLLALFVCAWLAARFGTSILIAGFTVGVVVALLGEPRRVADQLVGLGEGFAVPLFFVHLGAQLDLGALLHSAKAIELAVALAVVAIAIHVATAVVWRLDIGVGLLASAQLGVPAAAVSVGLATNQLTAAQGAAVMASVLVTFGACSAGDVLLRRRRPPTSVAPVAP